MRRILGMIARHGIAIAIVLAPAAAHAAGSCAWTGSAGDNKWSNGSNWNLSGGGSCPPNGIPAIFSSGPLCNIDANASPSDITINSGYTATITQQSTKTITLSGAFTQSGGIFVGGDSAIDISGAFTLSGTSTFKVTSGRLTVGGQFSASTPSAFNAHPAGTYIGRVVLKSTTATQTFNNNSISFNDLYINDGLAGYWWLDSGSGSTAVDKSGYGNDGTLTNATWETTAANLPPALAFKNDAAAIFSGGNSSISLGVTAFPALNGAQTVSMWVYYAAIPSAQQSFMSIASTTGSNQIGFFDTGGVRTIRVWKRVTSTDTSLVTASTTPASGWHHIAYTFSGSTHTLYVDGASASLGTTATSGTPTAATLGMRTDSAEFFSGKIDDVRVYKRLLSATEVGRLYAGGQPQTSVATQTLSSTLNVNNDLVIASGTLAGSTNAINVGGNWLNIGGLFTGTGTVAFTGTGTSNVIRSGGQSFGGINVSGAGTWTLGDALSMSGNTITAGTGALTGLSYSIRAGTITGNFTPGTGAVTLDGSSDATLPSGSYGGLTLDTPEPTLAGYWKLDEGTGTTFSDSSGNGNTGTLYNGPTWSSSVSSSMRFSDPYSMSVVGGSTADHGEIPIAGTTINPTSSITIAYWMYYASIPASSSDALTLKSASLVQTGFLRGVGGPCVASTCLAVWASGAGTSPLAYLASPSSTPGWYHFAYTWDGTNSKLYINGVAATGTTSAPNGGTVSLIYLSTYDGTNEKFTGKLDDVRIYSTALSAAQIARLANGYFTSTTPPTYTLGGTTTVTGAISVGTAGLSIGGNTLTASSGLTVAGTGNLTMATTGGVLAIGAGQSLIMNGTLNASSTGASIKSVSGFYPFQVGSTATSTPTLNITGLAVQNTDTNGMWINANTSASTTFTRFDNIAFSNGTGGELLQIYAPALYLSSNGCTFDSGATTGTTSVAVLLTGNGTSDGETRAVFGNTTCANNWTAGSTDRSCLTVAQGTGTTAKSDGDADGNGVADSPVANGGAVVQFIRGAGTDTAGTLVGMPTAAFNWNTFAYYSTYAAYNTASGTSPTIYVRNGAGTAQYSWTGSAGETILGAPRWYTDTTTGKHYLYVAMSSGSVYQLIDTGAALTTTGAAWTTNPYNCTCTIVTPLGMDTTNLYWGGTQSGSQKLWTLSQASPASQPMGSPFAVTGNPTITNAAPLLWTSGATTYLFVGTTGHILEFNVSAQTPLAVNDNPGTASIWGRIAMGTKTTNRVLAGDDGGNLWSIDPTSFTGAAKQWVYPVASDSIKSSPYYDYSTDTVMFGTEGGKVLAINAVPAPTTPLPLTGYPYVPGTTSDAIRSAPLYRGGVLLVGSTTGKLFLLDRNNGTTGPALIQEYYFGPTESVSGIAFDPQTSRYMVTTSDSSAKDGKLYYIDAVTDPTPGAS